VDPLNPGDPRVLRTGTVSAVDTAAHTLTVLVDDQQLITVPALRSLTMSDALRGDVAVLVRDRHALVAIGMLGPAPASAPPPPPQPPTPPPPSPVTVTLAPYTTGSSRNGAVRGDTTNLYQADWTGAGANSGWAHYRAPGIDARVAIVRLTLMRGAGGVYAPVAPQLHLWTENTPVGNPTAQAYVAGPALSIGQQATVTLPNDWGAALLSGAAGGIGIRGGTYLALAGTPAYAPAMTVTVTYTP
jgi:hypothetical protein